MTARCTHHTLALLTLPQRYRPALLGSMAASVRARCFCMPSITARPPGEQQTQGRQQQQQKGVRSDASCLHWQHATMARQQTQGRRQQQQHNSSNAPGFHPCCDCKATPYPFMATMPNWNVQHNLSQQVFNSMMCVILHWVLTTVNADVVKCQ